MAIFFTVTTSDKSYPANVLATTWRAIQQNESSG